MAIMHTLKLCSTDVFQIIDALNLRADTYQQNARFLSNECEVNENIAFEDCSDPFEAKEIAKHYRDIAESIENQISSNC
ncbi:MAG TPA: hypothetical protein ENH35_03145 [Candidatus Moranbacteria bacterium]|nr:hypothetical protein BMS3Bbin08_01298 [bacterium BMS3Bbin08]HDZ85515.1 hypothetical protein [Candidatus Moranbacteria bacterium]